MAYRGPQEEAQTLVRRNANNGNPNTAYNMESKPMTYIPGFSTKPQMADPSLTKPAQLAKPMPFKPGQPYTKPAVMPPLDDLNSGVGMSPNQEGSIQDQLRQLIESIRFGGRGQGGNSQYPQPTVSAGTNRPDLQRYKPPGISGDYSGDVEFSLPNFPGLGPRIFPTQGFNPGGYLRNLFGDGSMVPRGDAPSNPGRYEGTFMERLRGLLGGPGGGG